MPHKMHNIIDYDAPDTASVENHLSVDEQMTQVIDHPESGRQENAFREGFAASSGIRQEAAESGGRLGRREGKDDLRPHTVLENREEENAGLADS